MTIAPRQFQRRIEDFACGHCGFQVSGSGYTNHCPKCLWSRHVDVNPGDRAAACGGLMEPDGLEKRGEEHLITAKCLICGHERANKVLPEDDFDAVLALAAKIAAR